MPFLQGQWKFSRTENGVETLQGLRLQTYTVLLSFFTSVKTVTVLVPVILIPIKSQAMGDKSEFT